MDLEELQIKAALCEQLRDINKSLTASYAKEAQLVFAHPKLTISMFQDEHATSRLFMGIIDLLKKEHMLLVQELNIKEEKDDKPD